MSQENRYVHIEGLGGRVTVCYRFDQPKGEKLESITAAFAWCCPEDQFRKLRGRKISAARFDRDEVHKITLSTEEGATITDAIKIFIMESVDVHKVAVVGADDSSFIPRWFQVGYTNQEAEAAMQQMFLNQMKQAPQQSACCESGSCSHG